MKSLREIELFSLSFKVTVEISQSNELRLANIYSYSGDVIATPIYNAGFVKSDILNKIFKNINFKLERP